MPEQMPITLELSVHGNVALLEMKGKENRLNTIFCKSWLKALEKVEQMPKVKALVTTGSGKFYSNGLDLEYLSHMTEEEAREFGKYFLEFQKRLLYFPMVTIAAINGHAFAGGFLLAFLHDYRVMHDGRGWMCLNEVDIGRRFPDSMIKLFQTKLTPNAICSAAIFGKRFTATEALESKLVDRICQEGKSVETAIEMAKELVKNRTYRRDMISGMKEDFYGSIMDMPSTGTTAAPAKIKSLL